MQFESYGGKRAVVLTLVYGLTAVCGFADRYRRLDRRRVQRLVFACKGNICRSPFAQAIAAKANFPAASFGLEAATGDRADFSAVAAAHDFGIDLSVHRAESATDFAVTANDLVMCFEPNHIERLVSMDERYRACQLTLLPAWSSPPNLYIHDPYGARSEYFRRCFSRIDEAVNRLIRDLNLGGHAQR